MSLFSTMNTIPGAKDPGQRDRNLYLHRIEIVGPLKTEPNRRRPRVYRELLDEVVTTLRNRFGKGLRTFSGSWPREPGAGPVEGEELDKLTALYRVRGIEDRHSFDESIKFAITGILLSPRFLFRGETESAAHGKPGPDQHTLIDEYSLASRLSFFLWSSIPDETLLELAGQNRLREATPAAGHPDAAGRALREP